MTAAIPVTSGACPDCGRQRGGGVACQFCDVVSGTDGLRLASVGARFGAYLLDLVLLFVTLVIGWLIWSLIVWSRGQSPGKQIVGIYCFKLQRGARATWGTMFLREVIGKWLIMSALAVVTLGIAPLVLDFRLTWNRQRQQLWDSVASTIVVRG